MDQQKSEEQGPAQVAAEAFVSLRLPSHLTLERLIAIVAARRRRRIEIEATTILNGTSVCGLWLSTDTREIILHAVTDSALHRQQFILHELGHMILRHDELGVSSDYAGSLFPNLNGEMVSRALARSSFVDDLEAAAETLADLLAGAIRDSTMEPRSFEQVFG
ncbi:hypothetical protein [Arthrobacter sp. W4I7]|uniref:hypothetical protein n=1 Tax=Arthrobacter sp. W4I7 TaxID=3042296 RepID=UPI00277EA1A1|nr:hypothetical protein [Arthrobacter sp. W4I7]MDQ0691480.1 hypothetical protein [Arthrobacter sp. W4I7]